MLPNKGFNLQYTVQPRHLNLMHPGKSCSCRLSKGVMSDYLLAVIRSWAQTNKTVQQDSGPDYLRMNKLAALRLLSGFTPRPSCKAKASSLNAQSLPCVWFLRGMTKPEQVAHFRGAHPIKLKRGTAAMRPSPRLPSDADPLHTYGSLPAFRSMETTRMMGCVMASFANAVI